MLAQAILLVVLMPACLRIPAPWRKSAAIGLFVVAAACFARIGAVRS